MRRGRVAKVSGCSLAVAKLVLTTLARVLSAGANELTGLVRQVYRETGFTGAPLLDGVSPGVGLAFLDEDPALPRRFFSARWRGFWYLPEGGAVDLHGGRDDRLDVRVDGTLELRRTPPPEMHTQVATLMLDAGLHEIVVEYEQYGGAYNLRLEWTQQHGSPRPLPRHYLFPERVDAGDLQLVARNLAPEACSDPVDDPHGDRRRFGRRLEPSAVQNCCRRRSGC